MKELIIKENKKMALLKKYGYDIVKSRDFILAKASLRRGSILEIGTGKGHFTVVLAKKGFRLTSIDLEPAPQRIAKEYLKRSGLQRRVRLLVMNAQNLNFSDHSFDSLVSVNFMHHAQRPFQCLAEMARVARTKIAIADINKKGEEVLDRVHRREGHKHPLSRISFPARRAFLQKKGFSVKTYKGFCQTILVAQKGV